MKKLLAIAVAATFAAPMIASADVTVGGNLQQEYSFGSTGSKTITDSAGDNEFTINATTPLHNGMTGTASITHDFNASGNAADDNAAIGNDDKISGKLGIKGNFGHVTIGSVSQPMDVIDGVVSFMPTDFDSGNGTGSQGINYTGAFGPVGVTALVRPKGGVATNAADPADAVKSQLGLTYKAGPFHAGLGVASNSALAALPKTRVALAYNGSNYSVGVEHDKTTAGVKTTSFGGKYSFGKAYVSASMGKRSGSSNGNSVKLGYNLGAKTAVYVKSTKAIAGTTRSNVIGMSQGF